MSDIELKESIAQAIQRLTYDQQRKLLEFINAMAQRTPGKEPFAKLQDETWEPLSLQIGKRPDDINALAIQETDLEPLIGLFSEEASAEELCKLL